MSLDTVVEDIREEARARAEDIRGDAEAEADGIVAEAEADAEEIRERREAEVERRIEQEREQELSAATLEAKQERLGARRDVVEDVREHVESELAAMEGDTRRELTRSLLEASLSEFDEDRSVSVRGRPEDADLLEDLAGEYDRVSHAGEADVLGGVIAESEGSKVRVNNSFDAVLDTVWDDQLKELSDRLFEQ